MKVICIDDYDLNGRTVKLTPGKIYDVYKQNGVYLVHFNKSWVVTNDSGIERWYHDDVLMPLEKWREIRLKELGI
jgi:hypothetical protein